MLLTLLLGMAVPQGCASPRSQAAMTRCADIAYRASDAAMARQYGVTSSYMKSRDARDTTRGGGFGYAAALLESQRAWLRFRDTQCVIESGRFASGSVQPMAQAQCRERLTASRNRELRSLVWDD